MKYRLISICLVFAFAKTALGFMQPSFDEFSSERIFNEEGYIFTQNKYQISRESLANKGFADSSALLKALPFVNLSGFGANKALNLRSTKATTYLNGVKIDNALPFYFGFAPLDTINPRFAENLSLTLGASAVIYGSGAKGGVVEFESISAEKKREFSVGGGYTSFLDGGNSGYNANAIYKDGFGDLFLDLGLDYAELGGSRLTDKATQMSARLGLFYDLNAANRLKFTADFYTADIKWAGLNTFTRFDDADYSSTMGGAFSSATKIYTFYPRMFYLKTNYKFEQMPSESVDRGEFFSLDDEILGLVQSRLTSTLGYEHDFSPRAVLEFMGFFSINSSKISDAPTITSKFLEFQSLIFKDQKQNFEGSEFSDTKFGVNAEFSYTHERGKFTLGTQNAFEQGKSTFSRTMGNDQLFVKSGRNHNNSYVWTFLYDTKSEISSKELTNAIFATEQYHFNRFFHIFGGVRAQRHSTKLEVKGTHKNESLLFAQDTPENSTLTSSVMDEIYSGTKSSTNFAFELMPSVKYSSSGTIYARFVRGYTNLPALYTAKRQISNLISGGENTNKADISWEQTDAKDEIYDTFELGFKDFFTSENLTAIFNANAFYTATQNEFYAVRNFSPIIEIQAKTAAGASGELFVNDGTIFGVYEKTRRVGVEVALSQYLFGGVLGFNESLSYAKAEFQGLGGWEQMPYHSTYKATLAVNLTPFEWLNLWAQGAFFSSQKVLAKRDLTSAENFSGGGTYNGSQVPVRVNGVIQEMSEFEDDLKAYSLIDVGVSVNLWGFTISGGVRNLLNTYYYDYYNRDSIDNFGFGYIIGNGRSYFVGMRYKY